MWQFSSLHFKLPSSDGAANKMSSIQTQERVAGKRVAGTACCCCCRMASRPDICNGPGLRELLRHYSEKSHRDPAHKDTMPRHATTAALAATMIGGADALTAVAGLLRQRGMFYSAADGMPSQELEMPDVVPEASPEPPPPDVFDVKSLAGISDPLGFFDPLGFSEGASEGKIRFYREVELKHSRVAMLAAVGFLVAESFHPLWGGDIDVPSYIAFQETPLQNFWPGVVLTIAVAEVFSVFTFESPFGGETWAIRSDHEPGNIGFDPLGLKPTSPIELKEMQTKELNNGRLAMIAIAGMVGQELATGNKLF